MDHPIAASLESRLKAEALARGFALAGIAPATEADSFPHFTSWLDRGFAGEMNYLPRGRDARRHPEAVLASVRSVFMVGLEYSGESSRVESSSGEPSPVRGRVGKVASYAQGPDYHRFIWDRVNELSAWLTAEVPGCLAHGVADTAPILERDFARRAGLGWFGKNTMLISKHRGSSFFLAAFLTDIELSPSPPHEATHCGTCPKACLPGQSCVTGTCICPAGTLQCGGG